LKTAFVTTIASAVVVATAGLGCQAKVTVSCSGDDCGQGGEGGSTTSGKAVTCPAAVPAHGKDCPERGLRCEYGEDECDESYLAECAADGRWNVVVSWVSCNPPPPLPCPDEPPAHGTTCEPPDQAVCDYEVWFCPVEARCVTGAWQLSGPDCNPPPPEMCFSLAQDECDAFPTCEWAVPGCGEPALPKASCHPIAAPPGTTCNLQPGLCPSGTSCQQVSIDPCVDEPCDACHQAAWLCVGP
jgi:hypothetical protein